MPAVFDLNDALIVQAGPDIAVTLGHQGQGTVDIQQGNGPGRFLDPLDLGADPVPDLAEAVIFQGIELVLGVEDGILQLLEPDCGIAFGPDQGLLAHIVFGHQVLKGIGDFKIITEDLVVFDPEVFDPGPFPVLRLQVHQPLLSLGPGFPQVVNILIEACFDDAALPDRDGRFLFDGPVQQIQQVFELIQILMDVPQVSVFPHGQGLADGAQHAQGIAHGDQVPGIGGQVGDPGHQPFQIIDGTHIFPHFVPVHTVVAQLLDRVEAALDGLPLDQGLFQEAVEEPGSHGRPGPVQDPEEGTALLLLPQGLGQLQVAAGGRIQQHIAAGRINGQAGHIGKGILLGIVEILQQSAGGQSRLLPVINAQGDQGGYPEMPQQELRGRSVVKIMGVQRIDGDMLAVAQLRQVQAAHQESLIADDLGRGVADDLVPDLLVRGQLRGQELAGTDIRRRDAGTAAVVVDAENIIIPALFQGFHIQVGTGGDHPDNGPFDHAPGSLRILDLLADGHFMAVGHQPGQVGIHRVIGHAAHGRPLRQAALLARQGQFQLTGDQFGVLKEHFIKVSQPVEQYTVRIFFFGLQIMLHHGR